MLITGFADYVNPIGHPFLSNAGLVFPVFMLINFAFLVFWTIFKPKWALIPFLGYVVCYAPVRTYIPLNVTRDVPSGAIKVLSYNVWSFAHDDSSEHYHNPIIDYIGEQDADIVCLQETNTDPRTKEYLDSTMNMRYKYNDVSQLAPSGDRISLYSKFPILSTEQVKYESVGNLSMAYRLKIGRDTVLVINNHLETTGLSLEDRAQFKEMLKGDLNRQKVKKQSSRLIDQLAYASGVRAPQADSVAKYIREHSDMSVICCGDFNDGPLSYSHRVISKGLTDCYVATGNGPGISYHYNGFFVRIDNIMCSEDWQPYKCEVADKIKNSDHYPIYCWLKKRANP